MNTKEDLVNPYEKHYGKFIKYHLEDGVITFNFQKAVFQHNIAAMVMVLNEFAVKFEKGHEIIPTKKYTEEDMRKCFRAGFDLAKDYYQTPFTFEEYIKSLDKIIVP